MVRPCPLCSSANTGGSPKSLKNSTDRGRLDIDYVRCDDCGAAWDSWHYIREDVIEVKAVRRGNGNLVEWGDLPGPTCKNCHSSDVKWLYSEGPWHRPGVSIQRYTCRGCGQIWQEMVREETGERVAHRVWQRGQKIDKEALYGSNDTGFEDTSHRNRGNLPAGLDT